MMTLVTEPTLERVDQLDHLFEQYYRAIYDTNMKDIPVSNHRLSVELVEWQSSVDIGSFGVLVTPWFISLLVYPKEDMVSSTIKVGQVVAIPFPAGRYECLVNYHPTFGHYLTCALISDTKQIESHEVAVALAKQMLVYLFERPNPADHEPLRPAPRSELEQKIQQFDDQLDKPMSRRALFGLRTQESVD